MGRGSRHRQDVVVGIGIEQFRGVLRRQRVQQRDRSDLGLRTFRCGQPPGRGPQLGQRLLDHHTESVGVDAEHGAGHTTGMSPHRGPRSPLDVEQPATDEIADHRVDLERREGPGHRSALSSTGSSVK